MHRFLQENKDLFWHFDKSKLDELPDDTIVEYILNYGDIKEVKNLFKLLGIKEVSQIFSKNTQSDKRTNYLPQTRHYFTLYFKRNAHGNIK